MSILIYIILLVSACYEFDNPVDPGSENYQGFPTERNDGFTITYNGNGAEFGTVPIDGSLYEAGDNVVVASNSGSLVLTGFVFVGWNTAADGSGTHYNPNNSFSMPASDITFYAVWFSGTTYSVTYDNNLADGGSVPADLHPYLPGTTATVLGNSGGLTKNGYRFYSWDTQNDGQGIDYWQGSSFTISADITLYADWDPDFAGGDGSVTAPFEVNSVEHLDNARYFPTSEFVLTADLDLDTAPWNSGSGWVPIGDTGARFEGVFEGGGHTVSNLFIDSTGTQQGLFGYINGATIRNLAVLDADITAPNGYAGVLAGASDSLGTDLIENCFVTGTLSAGQQSGGLIGRGSFITISRCFADVVVTGSAPQIGGLVGNNTMSGTVRDSYSLGSVAGTDQVGGLVGLNAGTVETSYAAGAVSGTSLLGGLIGDNSGVVTNAYYDTATTGQSDTLKGTGLSTSAMTMMGSFTAWDFATIWEDPAGVNYPYLQWQGSTNIPVPPVSYTITYNANGADSGIAPADANSYLAGAPVTIQGNPGALGLSGSVFAGWNTAADGSGVDYLPGGAAMPASNLNLYAKWEAPILVARWDFASGSELIDISPFGNDLNLSSGSPSYGNDGTTDYLEFTSTNDRLSVAGTATLESVADGQSFSFWYYGNSFPQGSVLSRFNGSQRVWAIGPQLAGQFNIMDSAGYIGGSAVNFGTGFNAGAWNHVVVTYDVIAGVAQVYINNSAPLIRTIDATYFYDIGTTFYIGNSADTSNAGNAVSPGIRVAQFRIYNYVLDATEVDAIFSSF